MLFKVELTSVIDYVLGVGGGLTLRMTSLQVFKNHMKFARVFKIVLKQPVYF